MAKHRPEPELPPCYALVLPGLEEIAAEEITQDLGGDIRKSGRGLIVFRVGAIDHDVLRLRTTEDVFLYAWGTDQLTYRAIDLDSIQRWTAREPDWDRLLKLHHAVRPRPKGRPTYRLVTQMSGKHGYLRKHAHEALAKGLAGKLPASWRHAEENASVEVWLTIQGNTAVCGVRLSDRTMRHRTWKVEHLPASLRPTLAAAMVRLAGTGPAHVVVDPMCGAGTLLGEQREALRPYQRQGVCLLGGDVDRNAVRAAGINLRRLGPKRCVLWPEADEGDAATPVLLARWDATRLPLDDASVDRILSNPPFGKQLGELGDIGPLYRRMAREYDRVLRPGGRVVLLVGDLPSLRDAVRRVAWKAQRQVSVRVLGQPAVINVWRKPEQ
ncbi:MAG: RNA methyltransferase [Planctomycetes bacterium]|nr:RNA methyltransferase [Planctomycetota bacterium]